MRALVIAPQPFFTPRGTPFSVYYRTLVTSELGVQVDLLTYGEGQDVDIPRVRIIRIPRFPFIGPVKVGPSFKKLFLDLFIIVWTVALLIRNRYDVVHAHEEAVFFCRFLKPVFRFKLVYDMHSSLPQQLSNFKFTTSRALIGTFEKLENTALRSADAVITICPELSDYAVPRMKDPRRHLLIENSIFDEVKLARRGKTEEPGAPLPPLPGERPIVAYAGTFEPYQGLDLLLEAFALARQSRGDAFLLMMGGSPDQVRHYRSLASKLGLEGHCMFTGRVEQSVVKRQLRRAAVLTSPRIEGTNTPLKIYEQLASGIPLVATRILSHTQVLDERVCFLADPEPQAMAAGLVLALADESRRRAVVDAALELYDRKYSRRAYNEKMQRLFKVLA